ncbi:hypothetical protein V5799_033558 [Amblyomma americanum]|uniref:BTB domain-containing protein n=1 Tax=Amblyomma americanum TaxID=6943 RepID=A0AAQ4DMZ7_AMBAM
MSDVQFRVEGRAFYAHKIILVNASPRFKSMLASKSAEGTTPVVQINDIRYDIFQLVMQYLYKGGCEDFDIDQNDVLELLTAATFFQLDGLVRFCEARCSKCVDLDNVVATYVHAKVYNAVQLLEYCQGFLLQNLVALLSYDDGVRKLLFGKRLHNHDVLSGLLLTLQARWLYQPLRILANGQDELERSRDRKPAFLITPSVQAPLLHISGHGDNIPAHHGDSDVPRPGFNRQHCQHLQLTWQM